MNVREELKAFHDEELTVAEREQVEAGLDAGLRLELEQIGNISSTLKAAIEEVAPVGLEKTLKALERPAPKTGWYRRPAWHWAAIGGVGVLVLSTMMPNMTQPAGGSTAEAAKLAMPMEGGAAGEAKADLAWDKDATKAEAAGKSAPSSAAPARARGGFSDEAVAASPPPADGGPNLGFAPLIIRNGNLSVRVADVRSSQQQAIDMARGLGGMVSDSNFDETDKTQPTAYVTLRVPEKLFESAMKRLSGLGDVVQRNVTGSDVSASVVDIEARLKSMRNEEDQYRTVLKATRRIGDILIVKDRLSQVRAEIESLDAQRRTLRNQATYSTITATFLQKEKVGEPKKPDDWAEESWASAINRLNGAGQFLGKAAINVVVFAPIWIPLFLVAWFLRRKAQP